MDTSTLAFESAADLAIRLREGSINSTSLVEQLLDRMCRGRRIQNEEKDVSLSGWASPINEKCSDYRSPELLFGYWKGLRTRR